MSRLTIVIPALGKVECFETTVLSVLENRPADCKILVPHCGDYEDPYSLSDEVTFLEKADAFTGLDLINAAVQAADGQFVHLLAAGATVTTAWTEAPLSRFDDPLIGSVCPLLMDPTAGRVAALGVDYGAGGLPRLVARGAKLHGRLATKRVLGPTIYAGFYRRQALQEVGYWHPAVGEQLADVDLALALAARGWTNSLELQSKIMIAPSPSTGEHGFRQAWLAQRLFWRHAAAAGWVKSLALHPWVVAWEALTSLPHASSLTQPLARLLAVADLPAGLRYHRQLTTTGFASEAACASEAVIPFPRTAAGNRNSKRPLTKAS